MKMDKETLLKHRFWLFLGGYAVCWVIGLAILLMGAGTLIETEEKKYTDAAKALKGATNPKNESFQKPWNKYEERFKSHKIAVWGQAWNVQQDFVQWTHFTDQAARA